MIYLECFVKEAEIYGPLISKSVDTTLNVLGIKEALEVSVTIVGDQEIQKINHEQRGIDKATDVLSFPMIDYGMHESVQQALDAEPNNPETGLVYLGDVVLSWDKVIKQKADYGHSVEREVSFLIVHSMLHLLGYDHMEAEEESLMVQQQKEVMAAMGIER